MTIQYLTQDNFAVQNGGQKMACDLQGIAIVMFKTNECPHCRQFWPIFNQLSKQDSRIVFACVNVENNRRLVGMARNTKTPINGVPAFILYYNGNPYATYKGKRNLQSFASFIDKVVAKIMPSEGPSTRSGPNSSFLNERPNSTNVSFGSPIEDQRAPPSIENSIPKVPHNAPYLAYVRDGNLR